jgi:hypothetical protein
MKEIILVKRKENRGNKMRNIWENYSQKANALFEWRAIVDV